MASTTPVVLFWSGGKDAALAYMALHASPEYQVVALLTTLSGDGEWVPMHGIHRDVIARQAKALGEMWVPVALPDQPSNEVYESALEQAFAEHLPDVVSVIASGDVFLQDVRDYRAQLIRSCGYEPLFPLWGCDTATWIDRWTAAKGLARVNSVDPNQLSPAYIGRPYDAAFVADLPAAVEAAGEKGAFHTVVTDLARFAGPVPIRLGPHDDSGPTTYAPVLLKAEQTTGTR